MTNVSPRDVQDFLNGYAEAYRDAMAGLQPDGQQPSVASEDGVRLGLRDGGKATVVAGEFAMRREWALREWLIEID